MMQESSFQKINIVTSGGNIVDSFSSDEQLQGIKSAIGENDINGTSMPSGGQGLRGWLSAIWKLLSDRIPLLANGRIPVDVQSLSVSVSNAQLEIANNVGNPIPISANSLPLASGAATEAKQDAGNTNLSSIDSKIPVGLSVANFGLKVDDCIATQISPVSIVGAGDNTILTPTTDKSLRISSLYFVATSAVNTIFKFGTATKTGTMSLLNHAADYPQPLALPQNTSFIINTASAVAINGYIVWWEV